MAWDVPPKPEYVNVGQQAAEAEGSENNTDKYIADVVDKLAANPRANQSPGVAMRDVETPGPIAQLSVPLNWEFTISDAASQVPHGYHYKFNPPRQTDVKMVAYHRGAPLNPSDGQFFHQLLSDNANLKVPKLLYSEQWENDAGYVSDSKRQQQVKETMRKLSAAMGVNGPGDNQFTNSHKAPDSNAPVFHVEKVELRNLKGKTVMEVEGYLTDPIDGKPQKYFKGTFMEQPTERGVEVHEFMLHSTNKVAFTGYKSAYSKALESAVWR
ncbi:MAG TPA: hypothetical protein V6D17_01330 [Candidatus Obscuribacterales bacterium]